MTTMTYWLMNEYASSPSLLSSAQQQKGNMSLGKNGQWLDDPSSA